MNEFEIAETGVFIEEADGSPSGFATKIKFPNGTLTNNGDGSWTFNPEDITLDDITVDTITIGKDGLHLLDTNESHDLIVSIGSDLTADRTLTITTGDSNRAVTINGDCTLNDWFDQALKTTSDPILAGLNLDGDLDLSKEGTATAGTQYDSRSITFTCSVWDTDNLQAEDRVFEIKAVGGSGADGAEPNYLDIYDNDGNKLLSMLGHPTTPYIFIPYALAHEDDSNTAIIFSGDDTIKIYAGGVNMIQCSETTQDVMYIGCDGDVDVYIGPAGGLFVEGSTGRMGWGSLATTPGSSFDMKENGTVSFRIWSADNNLSQLSLQSGNGIAKFKVNSNLNKLEIDCGGAYVYHYGDGVAYNRSTGIGALLDLHQGNLTFAKPVLLLEQDDVDMEFITFDGESADADDSYNLIDAANYTTPGSIVGWIKIHVKDNAGSNPIAEGDYYLPFYSTPTA